MAKWPKIKLGDVCDIERGGSPRPIDKFITENENGVNWIKIGDTTESMYITKTAQKIIPEGVNKSRFVEAGDFLLSNSMSFGRPYILKIDGCIHDGWLVLRDKNACFDKHFLYYNLSSPVTYEKFKSMAVGGVVNNLNTEMVKNLYIAFPPLEEQRRIASILDKVTDLIAKRRAQLEKLDLLVKSRFVEMFGVLGTDQFGWGLKKLGQCCEINPKKASDLRLQANLEVSFVPMTAVSENGIIDTSDSRKYDDVKSGFTYFSEEDVLFAKITPCMENGKGAVAKKLKNGIGFGSTEFHVLRPIYGVSDCYWLYVMSIFSEFRKEAELKMTGSAGQRRVPVSFLEEYRVALPPIELQKQFASFVQQIETTKSNIQKSLETLETLKKALMQIYF